MGIDHIFTSSITQLNLALLDSELRATGLNIEGVSDWVGGVVGQVKVVFVNTPSAQNLSDAQAVIDAHVAPDLAAINAVQAEAKAEFANIPNWATWDRAAFDIWYAANVTTAAQALPVLQKAIWGIIALRNATWPELQEDQ